MYFVSYYIIFLLFSPRKYSIFYPHIFFKASMTKCLVFRNFTLNKQLISNVQ